MTNRFGRMPVPPEMNTFKAEVRGDQHFVFGPQPQHRTVVSDAGEEGAIPAPRASLERHPADVGNESFFCNRHGERNHSPNDPLRAGGTNLAMHQFPLANDRNPPLDQVRYHPLSNSYMSSRLVDRGNPVCYLLPVIRSTFARVKFCVR